MFEQPITRREFYTHSAVVLLILVGVSFFVSVTVANAETKKNDLSSSETTLTGPQGPSGAKGDKGENGEVGATGPIGLAGLPDSNGIGSIGPQGLDGIPGAIGATGATGSQGNAGMDGTHWRDISPGSSSWDLVGDWSLNDGVLTAGNASGFIRSEYLGRGLMIGGRFQVRTLSGNIPNFLYIVDMDYDIPFSSGLNLHFNSNNAVLDGGSPIDISSVDFSDWVTISFVYDYSSMMLQIGDIPIWRPGEGGLSNNYNGGSIGIEAGSMDPDEQLQIRNIRYFVVDPAALPE